MAQSKYVLKLKDAQFPLLSENQPRTIIGDTIGRNPDPDYMPGIMYCHNVMPTKQGITSVGFTDLVTREISAIGFIRIKDVRVIYDTNKVRRYISINTFGQFYVLNETSLIWTRLNVVGPVIENLNFSINDITITRVDGISYMFASRKGCYTYNYETNTFNNVDLIGLEIADVLGVTSSYGYLVAYTENAVAWSSTTDPTDFTPSQITGSGGGNVGSLSGKILFATSNSLGFLIYAFGNVVAATYTGNVGYPFKFREVESSNGGVTLDRVTFEANSNVQFVMSKAGIQTINSQKAEIIFPEVTDFLGGKRFEDFDEEFNELVVTEIAAVTQMNKKISLISSRYLVISYGIGLGRFTHALIIDISLQRLGKIKLEHLEVFEYLGAQSEIAKQSIAFMEEFGTVKLLDFTKSNTGTGVIIGGKFQGTRTRNLCLLGMDIENIPDGASLDVTVQSSMDGKNFTSRDTYLKMAASNVREYLVRATALTHTVTLKGKFDLVTLELAYKLEGRR